MSNVCGNSLHIDYIRATRLTSTGAVASAPNNHVVTASPVILTAAPEIMEGESKTLVGGADCVCVSYKGKDKLLRWNLTLQLCALEPALIEILTGAALQVNGSAEPVGNSFPSQISCASAGQPPVAIEAWSDLWVGDAQYTGTARWIRWVFPMCFFQLDQIQLENDFLLPQVKGYTRANALWTDPYVDLPPGVVAAPGGFYFYDDQVPTAVCGYSTYST